MGRLGITRQRSSRGITIIEILVIIACIALLAGILFPLFVHLRQAGLRTKCASNMNQLASAFQTYAQDWSDYWPCPGGLRGDYAYWHQTSTGGLTRYLKQKGYHSVWCCPLMPEWQSYYPPRSYCMNSYLREPEDIEYPSCTHVLKGISASHIQKMNRTILLFEGLPLKVGWEANAEYVYIYRCCNWTGVKGYSSLLYPTHTIQPGNPWHGRVSNYLYADGHIVARRPGVRSVAKLSTHKEMQEWYADKVKFESVTWPKLKLMGATYE